MKNEQHEHMETLGATKHNGAKPQSTAVARMSPRLERVARAGFGIDEFCTAIDLSRAGFYNLPFNLRPRSILIGRRRIIIDTPAEYLAPLAAAQAQTQQDAA